MGFFRQLYLYEIKKILMRKTVWITTAIMLAATIFVVVSRLAGNYYVDGNVVDSNYNMFVTDRAYARELSGRAIDDVLLGEMQEAYAKVPEVANYTLTEEYQQYARKYSSIRNFAKNILGRTDKEKLLLSISWEDLYAEREKLLMQDWRMYMLSDGEIAYWEEKEQEIEKPFVYAYIDGWHRSVTYMYSMNMLLLLLIAVSLSPVFADEHGRRTDQLILCSRYGRKPLYMAKLAAGISFAIAEVLVFGIIFVLLTFSIYGTDGFSAPVQLIYLTSHPMTMGELAVLMYGLLMAAVVLYSIMVMVISEISKSNVATIGFMVMFLIISLFVNIPEQYRVIGQLFDMLPMILVTTWGILDMRLTPIPGGYLTLWQSALILYLIAMVVLLLIGKRCYGRYQIKSR